MKGKPNLWKKALRAAGVALVAFGPAPALAEAPAPSAAAAGPNAPYRVGRIEIDRPWILAPPPGASAAAAYFTMTNRSGAPDRLVRASSILAQVVQLGPAPVGSGQPPSLAPETQRLDLIGLSSPFQAGEKIPVTLSFARAGQVTAEFDVLASPPPMAAATPPR